MSNKINCVVSAFPDSYSEYGKLSVNFIQALLAVRGNDWNIGIITNSITHTSQGFIDEYPELEKYILDEVKENPDIWIELGPPVNYSRHGKLFNIGVDICNLTDVLSKDSMDGVNRMDLMLALSEHSRKIIANTTMEHRNSKGEIVATDKVARPVEMLHLGINKSLVNIKSYIGLTDIKEDFCFIHNGMWGSGYDVNNITQLIYTFMDTFKTTVKKPALILKTNIKAPSVMDVYAIKDRMSQIRKKFPNQNILPNVYLISGNMSDEETMKIYNNHRVRCMVSMSSNELVGLNLLEFSITGKPIIAPNWGSHVEYLENMAPIRAELVQVDKSIVSNIIVAGSHYSSPDINDLAGRLKEVYKVDPKKIPVNPKIKHLQMETGLDLLLSKYISNTTKSNYIPEVELFEL